MKKLVGDSFDTWAKIQEERMKIAASLRANSTCATFRSQEKDPSWFLRTEYLEGKSASMAFCQLPTLIVAKRPIQLLAYGTTALRLH